MRKEQDQAKDEIAKAKCIKHMQIKLEVLGIPYELNESGDAVISWRELNEYDIKWRQEMDSVTQRCSKSWISDRFFDAIDFLCVRQNGHDGPCRSERGMKLEPPMILISEIDEDAT